MKCIHIFFSAGVKTAGQKSCLDFSSRKRKQKTSRKSPSSSRLSSPEKGWDFLAFCALFVSAFFSSSGGREKDHLGRRPNQIESERKKKTSKECSQYRRRGQRNHWAVYERTFYTCEEDSCCIPWPFCKGTTKCSLKIKSLVNKEHQRFIDWTLNFKDL